MKSRWMIKPRILRRMVLLIRTMIMRNLDTPPISMVYGGLIDENHKGKLTYRAWEVSVNMKKLQTNIHNL